HRRTVVASQLASGPSRTPDRAVDLLAGDRSRKQRSAARLPRVELPPHVAWPALHARTRRKQIRRKGHSVSMLLDELGRRLFRYVHERHLVYAACWEDPRVDREALAIG